MFCECLNMLLPQDRQQWDLTKKLLSLLFRSAAAYAFKTGNMSASASEKYFESGKFEDLTCVFTNT